MIGTPSFRFRELGRRALTPAFWLVERMRLSAKMALIGCVRGLADRSSLTRDIEVDSFYRRGRVTVHLPEQIEAARPAAGRKWR